MDHWFVNGMISLFIKRYISFSSRLILAWQMNLWLSHLLIFFFKGCVALALFIQIVLLLFLLIWIVFSLPGLVRKFFKLML